MIRSIKKLYMILLVSLKNVHAAYQSMTPEDSESLMMAPRSANAADEKPVHVRGQPPKKTKASCPNTGIHMAMTMDPMTPAKRDSAHRDELVMIYVRT